MPRQQLERELQRLVDDILLMGSMAEKAILQAVAMLKQRDLEGSRQIVANDLVINKKRFAIENDCLIVIATQQPMASDLRALAAILELSTELERIGDYGKGIARVTLMRGDNPPIKATPDFARMADKACSMLHRSLEAFVRRDVEAARSIPKDDDELDALYNEAYSQLLGMIIANPKVTDDATHLLWVAHNLERAGDRVSNICERVIFTATGEMKELDMEETKLAAIS